MRTLSSEGAGADWWLSGYFAAICTQLYKEAAQADATSSRRHGSPLGYDTAAVGRRYRASCIHHRGTDRAGARAAAPRVEEVAGAGGSGERHRGAAGVWRRAVAGTRDAPRA